ncbi:restriction endonuclease [Sphingomicrobium clamense]|uniref:Restriction endonuclease n=1 Tax=Sphingomicrobium clamense TaxID=2851013 RepID=A0ABS6V7P7_9SPHN|nr:restriction endonuclease [Sphingomicrobium sp. B8]MBW0145539.1 restriction endonuclease [Sphingomicrobium sp. B8]
MKRLPSFNDFSPGIIGDVRRPLQIVASKAPNWDDVVKEWDRVFFASANNKRASTNVPATLTNLGLITRDPLALTAVGKDIATAKTSKDGAAKLVRHIVDNMNGMALIDAVRSLNTRTEQVTKATLKKELERVGITDLSTATTDHTTLLNWMIEAGLFTKQGRQPPVPDDARMKAVLGISGSERSDFSDLPLNQQIFVQALRRMSEGTGGTEIPAKRVIDECLAHHRAHFDEDQMRAKIVNPLALAGWLEAPRHAGAGRGGKSGSIKPSARLMGIPIESVLPDFDQVIPADLRAKIDMPLSDVKSLLESDEKFDRGLGLELLALKMILDIGIEPRAFRLRSRETAYAEVDLTAEGKNLLFSRWNFQCKCVAGRVGLGDVAKEVGLAIYTKAHVVAVVTTSDFTSEAIAYAKEITQTTHLQFLFVNGPIVDRYLDKGPEVLLSHIAANAAEVMSQKRGQPISPETAN